MSTTSFRDWWRAVTTPKPARVVRHPPPLPGRRIVHPDTTPLLQQRGWSKRGNTWHGHYATPYGTYPGRIEKRGHRLRPYIKNPPPQIQDHRKWACFHRERGGWWWVHLHTNPRDGDYNAVLAYIERILIEALAKR